VPGINVLFGLAVCPTRNPANGSVGALCCFGGYRTTTPGPLLYV
jgi:hypothetical protein